MGGFAGTVALITGAGSGLGRQLALDLSAAGATIAAIDLAPEPLAALAAQLPGKPFASGVADVTEREALAKVVTQLQERLGPIDLLLANAGIGIQTTAAEFRAADIEAQVRVNLVGVANSVEAVLPSMLRQHRGHLVAISSLASYRGLPRMAGYCASKAGLNALMESLRIELRPQGIAVTTVCPGWIRTPLTEHIEVPKPYMMEVEYAAKRILLAVERRRPFHAFPAPALRRVRLLHWLPSGLSDRLIERILRSLARTDQATSGR